MVDAWHVRSRFVAASIFLLAAAFVLAKTGRDALFVQERGIFDLPKAYIGIALISAPLAMGVLSMLRTHGPRRVRLVLPVATALALLLFSLVVRPGGGMVMTSFFMFVPLMWGVIFSVSWLLAADLLDGADPVSTARGYSLVGGAGILGGVVGAATGRTVAPLVDPGAFLWMAALGLVLATAVMAMAQHLYPAPTGGGPGPGPEPAGRMRTSIRALLSHPYTRALAVAGMAAAVAGVLVEFRFYLAATGTEGDGREKAAFFADFYLVLNLLALAVQVLVLPRLVTRIGLGGALLILPVVLIGGTAGLVISASLLVPSALRVAEGGLKSSIHRTSWEQAFLSVAGHERARAKVLVDGLAVRVAEGLAGGMLLLWLWFVVGDSGVPGAHVMSITALLAGSVAAWLGATVLLSREIRSRTPSARPAALKFVHGPLPAS